MTLAIVAVLVIGCQDPVPTPSALSLVAIQTAEPPTGEAGCRLRLNSGRLVVDQEVGLAAQWAGQTTVVVWPHGWVAVDQDGVRILLNDQGDPIARAGENIAFGGAEGPDGRIRACGEIRRIP